MLTPTPADSWVLRFTNTCNAKYDKALQQYTIEIIGNHVYIRALPTATGELIASEALYLAENLLAEKYSLTVLVGDEVLDSLSPTNRCVKVHKSMIIHDEELAVSSSDWLMQGKKENLRMARLIANQVGSVYVLSANRDLGHPIKAVIPFMELSQTLSLPPDRLIGQPAAYAAPGAEIVGAVRARVAREGLAVGQHLETYEFKWDGRFWPMEVEFVPLDQEGEIMVICRNKADHQRQYWKDIKDGLSR